MPDADPGLMTIFAEALERTDPAARAAYLDGACGDDAALRRRVEALLAAHDGAGRFLEPDPTGMSEPTSPETLATTPASGPETRPPSELATGEHGPDGTIATFAGAPQADRPGGFVAGQVIAGRYTLLEVLGEGGMGTVYRAEQTEPVKRQVALKLIKIGMDSRAVLARFDAERQALALMDHPNIARVYDGGTTAAGQPFFVMELVERRADHRVLRPASALGPGPAGVVRRRLPGGATRPPEGDHPPRPEARQRAGHRGRRPAHPQGHRLRRRQGDRIQAHRPEPGRHRGDRRHADVHVAGAGRPVVDGHRHPDRRLRAGRDPLRAAGRLAADRREAVQAGGDPGDAADGAGGRPAQAEHQGEHGGRPAEHRGQPRHRAGAIEAGAAGGPRLDRDEGAGEGPHPAVRDGQRLRGRRPAAPGVRAGRGRPAEPGVPAAEVRPEEPRAGDRREPGAGGSCRRHRGNHLGLVPGQAAGADRAETLATKEAAARGKAEDLATKEAKARGEADAKAEQLAREDYVSRVDRAYREVEDDNVALAEDLLHGCPTERRGWEWNYVKRLCNLERLDLDVGGRASTPSPTAPTGAGSPRGRG